MENYNKKDRGPLLWFQAAGDNTTDALAMLASVGILGEAGQSFGSSGKYARVNLVQSNSTFILLIQRFQVLCSMSRSRLAEKMEQIPLNELQALRTRQPFTA